jgi:hypothetical protein
MRPPEYMSDSCLLLSPKKGGSASCSVLLAGGFLTVTKLWDEDTLTLKFPIALRTEAIKGMESKTDKHKFIFFTEATNLSF